jgi:hypothetical protein
LVIDCTPAQHAHLQKLIKESLSSGDWKSPRPELGQGIFPAELPKWDFGVYQSERAKRSIEVRTHHHIFSTPLVWATIAVDSGLGAHLLDQQAFEMEVRTAVLEVPGITELRKKRGAEQMSPAISSRSHSYKKGKFHTAWNKYEHLAA